MKRFAVYFTLQLKRAIKLLPAVIAVSGVLLVALGLIVIAAIRTDAISADKQKFKIAIVGNTTEGYLELGVATLGSLDSSRFTFDILEMSESEARRALEAGELHAYAVIPDGFIEAAIAGDVGRVTYVTSPGAMDMSAIFKNEIADFVSEVLIHSQKGVYAIGNAMKSEDLPDRQSSMNGLALEYLTLILHRSKLYSTEITGVADSLSFGGYLFCGVMVFFLFMWGISCCPLFARRDGSLSRLLHSKGCSPLVQIIGEYLAYLALMLITLIAILLLISPFLPELAGFVPEFENFGLSDLMSFGAMLILPAAVIAAVQFFIYEAVGGIIGSIIGQFVCAVALSYVGGCLYPIYFFPDAVIRLSAFLPTAMARTFLASFFTNRDCLPQVIGLLGFLCVFLALGILSRYAKLRRCRV